VRRRYIDRGAQADARGAGQVLDRGAHAVARGAARCAPQVLDHGTFAAPPLYVAAFVVNSEPHIGARPSALVCAWG
jgi:hypothetical protein